MRFLKRVHSAFIALLMFGLCTSSWALSRIFFTVRPALQCSLIRIQRSIVPLGWKRGGTNFSFGGLKG